MHGRKTDQWQHQRQARLGEEDKGGLFGAWGAKRNGDTCICGIPPCIPMRREVCEWAPPSYNGNEGLTANAGST